MREEETETKLDPKLDPKRIEDLLLKILLPIRENYIEGPISRDRAYEALNALAAAAGVVIKGCDGADGEAHRWFQAALATQLWGPAKSRKLESEDVEVTGKMQGLAKMVEALLPYGWGFVVLAFSFGAGGRMNYASNAERVDVVRAMYEFIETTKGQWATDQPDLGAAAEDEQLARARQRVAELEGELERLQTSLDEALESRREWMEKTTIDRQEIARLMAEALNLTQLKDLEYLMEIAAGHIFMAGPFNSDWEQRAKKYQQLFHKRMVDLESEAQK